jgi:hypothetical protein
MNIKFMISALLFSVLLVSCQKETLLVTDDNVLQLPDKGDGSQDTTLAVVSACEVSITIPEGATATITGVGGTGAATYTCPQGNQLTTTGTPVNAAAGTGLYTVSGPYVIIKLTSEAGGTVSVKSPGTGYVTTRTLSASSPYFVLHVNPNSCNAADFTSCLP